MPILVTGASAQIGDFLLPMLTRAGHKVHAVSRHPRPDTEGVSWFFADLGEVGALHPAANGCSAGIHMAPIWTLPEHLPGLAADGVRRIIAFSSTSRFTKQDSADPQERTLVNRLVAAEEGLIETCSRHGVAWTLFRPTLVYGAGRDQNVTSIKRFVQRLGFFPVAGEGRGLRQPVHAEDLAQACLAVLTLDAACNRAFNLSGGETLDYRTMVERVFRCVGRRPRILSLPLPPLRLLLRLAALLPRYRYIRPGMADRMNRDLVYDHSDASTVFGYKPRGFDL